MCSLSDDFVSEETNEKCMPEKQNFAHKDMNCNKCRRNQPKVLLRNKDPYCKTCFLQGTLHRFKAVLGKHRFIHANDRILMVHAGGHPSTALLHFLRSDLDSSTPKKMRIVPVIVFVECQYGLSVNERRRVLQDVGDEVKSFDFPLYYVSLSEYVTKGESLTQEFNEIKLGDGDETDVMALLKQDANLTIRQEIVQTYERRLIIHTAKLLGCTCAFTTEIGVDIASQILTNISLGRGSHLPLDVGVCDSRDHLVKIIRPLRMYEIKELAFYNIFNNLNPVVFPPVPTGQYKSIRNLTTEFVHNLERNFPATVNTIVRTGDKLSLDKSVGNSNCLLCQAPINNNEASRLTSAESTNFSHWLSTQTPNSEVPPENRYLQTVRSFDQSNQSRYCFACNKIERYLIKKCDF